MARATVEFEGCEALRSNDAETALLIEIEGKQLWIPQFAIDDDSEVYRVGDTGKLVIWETIATEKGLI